METARRLGTFSLVLALLLYLLFDRSGPDGPAWRGQLLVYSILFAVLGFILLSRYRVLKKRSSRFQWLKNFLFRSRSGHKRDKKRRRGARDEEEDEAEEG